MNVFFEGRKQKKSREINPIMAMATAKARAPHAIDIVGYQDFQG
jgi:hypothetical protein